MSNLSTEYQDLITFIDKKKPSTIVIVTDNIVAELYLDKIEKILQASLDNQYSIDNYVIPSGERYKTRETKTQLEDYLLDQNYDKKICLIALGGGVVTDLVGFVAATYMRGVSVIYIPTTLLAMVDAAIGGKTAVNTAKGKNLIGCFKQPDLVIIESLFLTTLNNHEYISAFAEIIKHALISDKDYFNLLIKNSKTLLARQNNKKYFDILNIVIAKSIEIKTNIVNQDEHENLGVRHQLNFGHTIGHAIEAASDYKISHGYAVAIGIVFESFISLQMNILKQREFESIVKIIKMFKLDDYLRPELFSSVFLDEFYEAISRDKKNSDKKVKMVLLESVGECYSSQNKYSYEVDLELIKMTLGNCLVQTG